MAGEPPTLDLAGLRVGSGQVRKLEAPVGIEPLRFGGERYAVRPAQIPAALEVGRLVGPGYELKLRFHAELVGPCVRCLNEAQLQLEVAAREVHSPGEGEELDSPYVTGGLLDLGAWARDALVLSLPVQILCRADCKGLCPVCAVDLNVAEPGHSHGREPDARLAPLGELLRRLQASA